MKFKRITAAALSAAIAMGMSACGSGGRSTDQTAANNAAADTAAAEGTHADDVIMDEAQVVEIDENQETGTIKILAYHDIVSEFAEIVDLFETRYNGSIEQELVGSGDAYFDKLATLIASDLSPDIVTYEWRSFPHLMSRNMYTPLDSYIDLDSDLWSGMKEIAEQYVYGGKHYHIPYKLKTNFAINYNRLCLQEYGLPDPMDMYNNGEWTWDTFRDLLKDWCNADPNHVGYTGVNAMSFVATTGTTLIDATSNEIKNNLKDNNVQRAMEYLEDLCRQGFMGTGYVDPGEAFVDGTLLFLGMDPEWAYGAAWESLFKKKIDCEMAFVPFPRDPQSDKYYIAYNSVGYMVPSGAKNVKGAVDWITLNRIEQVDPENMAKAKERATDSATKYYPKCPSCKYSFVEHETEDLTVCPECNTERKVRFNAYLSEEQYDLQMDMSFPENGKFSFVFDDFQGFNADLNRIFEGSDEALLDGPVFHNMSYTQLRDEYWNTIEAILNEYREKMAQG